MMLPSLMSISCFLLLTTSWALPKDNLQQEWDYYKSKHGKSYPNLQEDKLRLQRFLESKAKVEEHNEAAARGEHTFFKGINQFSDLFEDEVKAHMGCVSEESHLCQADLLEPQEFIMPENFTAPKSVDWRKKGAVTPVKNQGKCGSCWAFGTVGSLETQHFLKTGNLVALSEQNLVECVYDQSKILNVGCGGGFPNDVFIYVKQNGGIDTEASYPYIAGPNMTAEKCHYNPETRGATVSGYVQLPTNDEKALEAAVATVGPVTVVIMVSYWDEYKSGVYTDPSNACIEMEYWDASFKHAILVVGYGTDEATGLDYWLLKNSFGADWGEDGYMKFAKGSNLCNIAHNASYPLV